MKLALSALMTLVWLIAHVVAAKQTSAYLSQLTNSKALQLFVVDLFNYFAIACSLAITAVTRISFLVKTLIIMIVTLLQVVMNFTILSSIISDRLSIPSLQAQRPAQLLSSPISSSSLQSSSFKLEFENSNNNNNNNFIINGNGQATNKSQLDQLLDDWFKFGDGYHFDQYIFTMTLCVIFYALYLMNKQFELTNRRLFLRRKQVELSKEKVADMRQKNEALVYNILPPNVAKIFLGKKTINDEELYSKSYDAVGVLFAAMPNFSDFYTEESVNNQGLECLRFLNEVISDYDALLDQNRFKNIIKIKTMGSTYMAASGLYEGDAREERLAAAATARRLTSASGSGAGCVMEASEINGGGSGAGSSGSNGDGETEEMRQLKEIEAIREKWGHLEQLTEFALALKETLNNINKESFNNLLLRIGINQGPITAGVIGVKKPHFDMWGNTVNVASRMESTGRAGSIQVVEETADILRHFGFEFEQRGLVSVKGKGKLMTFYLTGRRAPVVTAASTSVVAAAPLPASGVAASTVGHQHPVGGCVAMPASIEQARPANTTTSPQPNATSVPSPIGAFTSATPSPTSGPSHQMTHVTQSGRQQPHVAASASASASQPHPQPPLAACNEIIVDSNGPSANSSGGAGGGCARSTSNELATSTNQTSSATVITATATAANQVNTTNTWTHAEGKDSPRLLERLRDKPAAV